MRQYMILPGGGEIFRRAYMSPRRSLRHGNPAGTNDLDQCRPLEWTQHNWERLRRWFDQISAFMATQTIDAAGFERGRRTEIDSSNGRAQLGADNALPVSMNAAITRCSFDENGACPPTPCAC